MDPKEVREQFRAGYEDYGRRDMTLRPDAGRYDVPAGHALTPKPANTLHRDKTAIRPSNVYNAALAALVPVPLPQSIPTSAVSPVWL